MKLLDRHILREIFGYFLLGLGVFGFVLMMPELLRLSELLARESLSLGQMAGLLLSVMPPKMVWVLSLAVLVGMLMGVSRLAADREIIAMQASGLGIVRMLRPAMLFSLLAGFVTLGTTVWWGPAAARNLGQLQEELGAEQLFYEVRPRVFEERFPGRILYVQETSDAGTSWKGVFLADLSKPDTFRLTLASRGTAVPDETKGNIRLLLQNGATHEYTVGRPERYSLVSFARQQLTVPVPNSDVKLNRRRNAELGLRELWDKGKAGKDNWRIHRADFHRRFALPAACVVFGLLAFPLGMLSQTPGRTFGFVLAVAFGLGYYFLFLFSDRMAREGVLPVGAGVWAANLVFAVLGLYLISKLRRPPGGTDALEILRRTGKSVWNWLCRHLSSSVAPGNGNHGTGWRWVRTLDVYMLRGALFHFVILQIGLLLLFGLFQLLEMLDEIVANQVSWDIVARFLWYLIPQAVYLLTPLALLLAVLVELALMTRRNEIVALKSAGVNLYRIIVPVLVLGLGLSGLLFWMDSTYLPVANQRQEALRSLIRGRPARTFFQLDRRWLFGESPRIYHYSFFDSTQNVLARLEVMDFDPEDFSLKRRLFAERAHWEPSLGSWVLQNGWQRSFSGVETKDFEAFQVKFFPELSESPDYFRKEIRESAQMNWVELSNYIAELRQAGFDVTTLVVEWHKKFAFPLISPVMVLIAFPFGLAAGRRGALGGVALGIGLGLTYWILMGFFQALGNFGLLPPMLSGWGPNILFAAGGLYLGLNVET